jgi:hypothetical protein
MRVSLAEQRPQVSIDPTAIDCTCYLSLVEKLVAREIPIENLIDCQRVALSLPALERVLAMHDGVTMLGCQPSCLLGCDRTMLADRDPALAALGVSIVEHIRLATARHDEQAKPADLTIPNDNPQRRRRGRIDHPFRDLWQLLPPCVSTMSATESKSVLHRSNRGLAIYRGGGRGK